MPLLDADPQGLLGPRDTRGLQTGLEKQVGGGWAGRWVSFVEGAAGDVVSEMLAPWLLWWTMNVHCDPDPLWSCSLLSQWVARYHFFFQWPVKPLTDTLPADTSAGKWEKSKWMKNHAALLKESISYSPQFSWKLWTGRECYVHHCLADKALSHTCPQFCNQEAKLRNQGPASCVESATDSWQDPEKSFDLWGLIPCFIYWQWMWDHCWKITDYQDATGTEDFIV